MSARDRFIKLVDRFGGQTAVAKKLGVSLTTVHWIYTGRNVPNMRTARSIERFLGIPMREWVPDAKR